MAKGFSQHPGFNYIETFALTVRVAIIRTALALAAIDDMYLRSIDISHAFINGVLDEEIYMQQLEGYHFGNLAMSCISENRSMVSNKLVVCGIRLCTTNSNLVALFVPRQIPPSTSTLEALLASSSLLTLMTSLSPHLVKRNLTKLWQSCLLSLIFVIWGLPPLCLAWRSSGTVHSANYPSHIIVNTS